MDASLKDVEVSSPNTSALSGFLSVVPSLSLSLFFRSPIHDLAAPVGSQGDLRRAHDLGLV